MRVIFGLQYYFSLCKCIVNVKRTTEVFLWKAPDAVYGNYDNANLLFYIIDVIIIKFQI